MSSVNPDTNSAKNTSSLTLSESIIVEEKPSIKKSVEINSIESLWYAIQENSSTGMKQKRDSLSPKKFGNLSLKASNSLSSNNVSDIDSIAEMNSMNQSSFELTRNNKQTNNFNEFERQLENEEENADSPNKLKKKLKNFTVSQKISLLCPPQELWQKSYQFLNEQYKNIDQQTHNHILMDSVKDFLINPLRMTENSYMRYIFEIHLFKNFDGEMIHLARSEKDSLTVSSSHLLYATNPHKSGDKQFVAKLKYNTAKSEYNLYDIDEKEHPNQPRKLLATGFYDKPLGDQRDIKLYIPKLEFSNNDFIKSETNKNMVSFYNEKQSPIYRQIELLKTTKIPKENEAIVRDELQLRNQGRKILVVNEEGHERFYMGKKQDQRYVILAAGGMTPLQVFTLAILNLDH